MVGIAYLPTRIYETFTTYFMLIVVTSFMSGFIMFVSVEKSFINQLIVCSFSLILLYIFSEIYNQQRTYKTYMCKIKIKIDEVDLEANAFIDTGNILKDSMSGESVIFVSMNLLKENLPENLIKILKAEVLEIDEEYDGKIKMIEYKTINNDENILIGIKADSVIIEKEKYIIVNEKIIIAPTEKKFKKFEALIGLNVLEEGYVYGDTTSFETQSKKIME